MKVLVRVAADQPPRRSPERAVEIALEQVGFKLVASGLTYCLANPEQAAESGYDLDRVEKMFMRIG